MQLGIIGLVDMLAFAPVSLAIVAGIIITALLLAITTGQGGSRVNTGKPKAGATINRNDDKHWKLGIFYYNPEDPAVFIEKRFGIGWTANLARPLSWFLLIGLFALLGFIYWLTTCLIG